MIFPSEVTSDKMLRHSRTPPRQLGAKETLESPSHWQTTFRTFYKKDDSYKIFSKKIKRGTTFGLLMVCMMNLMVNEEALLIFLKT